MFVLDMSSLRIYLLPVLLWLCAASLRAQPDSIPPEVYRWYPQYVTFLPAHRLDSVLAYTATDIVPMVYKVNKYTLYPNAQLDSIVGLINRVRHDFRVQLAYVWIGGSASPEGPVWWNKQLGDYRSKALAAYLKDKAQLPDSLLRVENLAEDWFSTERALRRTPLFPHRDRILDIIADEPDWNRRKERIRAIDGGRTWSRLIREMFAPFRNARMVIVCHAEGLQVALSEPLLPPPPATPVYPTPFIPAQVCPHTPASRFFALKTNALFAAALVANLGFEAELWPKWSIDIPVWYSPYDITPTRKLRLLATQPELRRWTKKAGEGHFIGLHTHIVGFNVAINEHGRYQDPNHALWGMGLSYGYACHLDRKKRWGLELNIGAGFAEYSYDTYRNWPNGPKVASGSNWYWGVTRAGVSISYKWYKQRKNKKE